MLLVFAKTRTGIARAMKQRLNGTSQAMRLEYYTHLDDLLHRLHRPRMNLKIGVLSIGSRSELDCLLAVKDLLADMRLILVLPDNHPQTLSKAHALSPRFITFVESGMAALTSVVEKMLKYHDDLHDDG